MADLYARRVLRRTVALISQAIGYDLAQNTSIEVLTDILERYLYHSGKSIHDLAEQCKLFGEVTAWCLIYCYISLCLLFSLYHSLPKHICCMLYDSISLESLLRF